MKSSGIARLGGACSICYAATLVAVVDGAPKLIWRIRRLAT